MITKRVKYNAYVNDGTYPALRGNTGTTVYTLSIVNETGKDENAFIDIVKDKAKSWLENIVQFGVNYPVQNGWKHIPYHQVKDIEVIYFIEE